MQALRIIMIATEGCLYCPTSFCMHLCHHQPQQICLTPSLTPKCHPVQTKGHSGFRVRSTTLADSDSNGRQQLQISNLCGQCHTRSGECERRSCG